MRVAADQSTTAQSSRGESGRGELGARSPERPAKVRIHRSTCATSGVATGRPRLRRGLGDHREADADGGVPRPVACPEAA